MATQALYRKYRPRTFDEVVGQVHVTRTLRNALAGDRVSHAYLFTGPRGTGKTTTARLLAKAATVDDFAARLGLRATRYRPAAARSSCALSVRSQLNSGSSRPKWP